MREREASFAYPSTFSVQVGKKEEVDEVSGRGGGGGGGGSKKTKIKNSQRKSISSAHTQKKYE